MDRILKALLCGAVAVAVIGAADQKPAATQAQVGSWEIDYDTAACHLTAKFGDGDQASIVRLTRYQPGDSFDLLVYGQPYKFGAPSVGVRVGFGLAAPIKREAVVATAGNKLPMLFIGPVRLDGWTADRPDAVAPPLSPDAEAKADVVDLQIPGGKRFRLETGSFAKPMAAMRACTDDLIKSWGYDPAQHASLSAPVRPTTYPGDWLNPGDYPPDALRAGEMGMVQFRLDIDPAGKVIGCHVLHRTNPDKFADRTCWLIGKRARFTPARDKDGKPVASYYINRARFVIPD